MRTKDLIITLIICTAFLTIWELSCRVFSIAPFILPAPSSIITVFFFNYDLLLFNSLVTFSEIVLGIVFSLIFSVPLALFMYLCPAAERSLSPFLIASQAIPVFALAPLLVTWFGYGITGKIVMASLIIFFPVTVNLLEGFKSCETEYINMFKTMGAGRIDIILHLLWPWALPAFFTGLKIGVSVATIGAVIGEWVGAQKGLGALMIQANARLEVDMVFAAIACLTLMGLFLWKTAGFIEKKIIRWK
jgi:putative hydroxymethylpyrimidine transport system permease protein